MKESLTDCLGYNCEHYPKKTAMPLTPDDEAEAYRRGYKDGHIDHQLFLEASTKKAADHIKGIIEMRAGETVILDAKELRAAMEQESYERGRRDQWQADQAILRQKEDEMLTALGAVRVPKDGVPPIVRYLDDTNPDL